MGSTIDNHAHSLGNASRVLVVCALAERLHTAQSSQSHSTFYQNLMHLRPESKRIVPDHFYSLDALRGLAALSVVFWHWGHFVTYGKDAPIPAPQMYPLYYLFAPLYLGGWRAVNLFFCLSGFIFFWLYSGSISEGKLSSRDFFYLRLSRLYPLHLLTLLIVAVCQQYLRMTYGSYFVYQSNDLYHFLLQLLLASNWGFLNTESFNGPAWSVSVEVFCYAVFFLACSQKFARWNQLVLFVLAGWMLEAIGFLDIGRGLFSFFTGALAFKVYKWLIQRDLSPSLFWGISAFAFVLWIFIPLAPEKLTCFGFLENPYLEQILTWHGKNIIHIALIRAPITCYELLLFPLTIIALALFETKRGTLGKRVAFLGNISYSSYLLHFPLQLIFIAFVPRAAQSAFFLTPLSIVAFFAVLIFLSVLSYQKFERPVQRLIRRLTVAAPTRVQTS